MIDTDIVNTARHLYDLATSCKKLAAGQPGGIAEQLHNAADMATAQAERLIRVGDDNEIERADILSEEIIRLLRAIRRGGAA